MGTFDSDKSQQNAWTLKDIRNKTGAWIFLWLKDIHIITAAFP